MARLYLFGGFFVVRAQSSAARHSRTDDGPLLLRIREGVLAGLCVFYIIMYIFLYFLFFYEAYVKK